VQQRTIECFIYTMSTTGSSNVPFVGQRRDMYRTDRCRAVLPEMLGKPDRARYVAGWMKRLGDLGVFAEAKRSCEAVSPSVSLPNPALRLYLRFGSESVVETAEGSATMIK